MTNGTKWTSIVLLATLRWRLGVTDCIHKDLPAVKSDRETHAIANTIRNG